MGSLDVRLRLQQLTPRPQSIHFLLNFFLATSLNLAMFFLLLSTGILSSRSKRFGPRGFRVNFLNLSKILMEDETKESYPPDPERYILRAEIGRGAFATVYLASCLDNNVDVAIKILDLDELDTSWEEIRKEISLMRLLNHPNVVPSLCSFVVEQEIWLVMPLMAGGSCADIMKNNFPKGYDDEVLIATILKETLTGIEYFHKEGRIHRDVKAGNILISQEGEVQMGDFGVAGTLIEAGDRKRSRRTFVGTPCWMAPEVMEQTHGYDYKADIWSFGITALEIAFGKPPYADYQPMKVMLLTLQEDPPSTAVYENNPKKMSKAFRDLVKSCLKKDPTKRPTASKLLEHKFFKSAKKSEYVKTNLLDIVAKPKWIAKAGEVLDRAVRTESHATKSNELAWEFDMDEFDGMKVAFEREKDEQKGRFTIRNEGTDDELEKAESRLEEPEDNIEDDALDESAHFQKGRFTVKDSE